MSQQATVTFLNEASIIPARQDFCCRVNLIMATIQASAENLPLTFYGIANTRVDLQLFFREVENYCRCNNITLIQLKPWQYNNSSALWSGLTLALLDGLSASSRDNNLLLRLGGDLLEITGLKPRWGDDLYQWVLDEPWSPAMLLTLEQELSFLADKKLCKQKPAVDRMVIVTVDTMDHCSPEIVLEVIHFIQIIQRLQSVAVITGVSGTVAAEEANPWIALLNRSLSATPLLLPGLAPSIFLKMINTCLSDSGLVGPGFDPIVCENWSLCLRECCYPDAEQFRVIINEWVARLDPGFAGLSHQSTDGRQQLRLVYMSQVLFTILLSHQFPAFVGQIRAALSGANILLRFQYAVLNLNAAHASHLQQSLLARYPEFEQFLKDQQLVDFIKHYLGSERRIAMPFADLYSVSLCLWPNNDQTGRQGAEQADFCQESLFLSLHENQQAYTPDQIIDCIENARRKDDYLLDMEWADYLLCCSRTAAQGNDAGLFRNKALELANSALTVSGQQHDRQGQTEAHVRLLECYMLAGDDQNARYHLNQAQTLADKQDDEITRMHLLQAEAAWMSHLGKHAQAQDQWLAAKQLSVQYASPKEDTLSALGELLCQLENLGIQNEQRTGFLRLKDTLQRKHLNVSAEASSVPVIFLSYKSEQFEIAVQIKQFIEKHYAVKVWRDKDDIEAGDSWDHKIYSNLLSAQAAVVLICQGYLKSEYCLYEARILKNRFVSGEIPLLWGVIETIEPSDELSYYTDIQALNNKQDLLSGSKTLSPEQLQKITGEIVSGLHLEAYAASENNPPMTDAE